MRKLSLLLIALATTSASFSQKVALQTAINWLNYDDLDKAKEAIEQAASNESTSQMSKTWYYRGQIYHAIYETPKEQFKPLKPGSLDEAYRSYEKTITLDTKGEYADDLNRRFRIMGSQFQNEGVDQYRDKKYSEALASFEKAISLNDKYVKAADTLAYYHAALSADKAGNAAKAQEYYSKVISMNYGGAKIYNMLSSSQMAQKDTVAALQTLKQGRQKYPSDVDLSIAELNFYLNTGRTEEARIMIDQALMNDPKNPSLYNVKGMLCEKSGKSQEALAAYKTALDLKPDFFEPNYNVGALLFNEGAEILMKANALPMSKQKEYDELKAKATAKFGEARPYLEKAYQINPKDQLTIDSLAKLYAQINEQEKAKEMKKLLESSQ